MQILAAKQYIMITVQYKKDNDMPWTLSNAKIRQVIKLTKINYFCLWLSDDFQFV